MRQVCRWGRIDDFSSTAAYVFPRFEQCVFTHRIDEVRDVLRAVEVAIGQGWWALGFLSYEASAGLDPTLPVAAPAESLHRSSLPLVWFGLTSTPPTRSPLVRPSGRYRTDRWTADWNEDQYVDAFNSVKAAIADGRTYQCNLTSALRGSFAGDARSFYADLAWAQRSSHCAYLDLGRHVIASASPELFFEWRGSRIVTKPMKGTAARGASAAEDARLVAALSASPKEQAENIIIVDLLRNDLAKIARTGSVSVEALLTPEAYPTVWQMTSQIAAEIEPTASLEQVMSALFPCGSVTGAPKAETMGIIRDVEARRRGIYCGAVGLVAPATEEVRARFNVAIRTAHIDRTVGTCEYGIGSGITWDSEASAEFAELRAKRRILDATRRRSLHVPTARNRSSPV